MPGARGVQQRQRFRSKTSRRKHRNPRNGGPNYYTQAGPVKVTRADGSVEVQPAYSKEQFQRIVRVRANISQKLGQRIFLRDHQTCRYCGDTVGPFDIDHVVPVALGGSNGRKNLVTACRGCNSRKGANVWKPRPIRSPSGRT